MSASARLPQGPSLIGAVRGLRADARVASVTMCAVLASFGTALALRSWVGYATQNVVLAVVLAMTLARTTAHREHGWGVVVLEVPCVALAAAGTGWLIVHQQWIGQPLLVVALSVGIYVRRYGDTARRFGRLITLPFLALLITPAPTVPGTGSTSVLWAPVVALVAVAWVGIARLALPGPGDGPAAAPAPDRQGPRRRLDAPTRMAAQMAVGLGAAFVAGHLLFGDRWGWTVLSAFLVASGNRGRGDVMHKAGLRLSGAAVGTIGASLVAGGLPAGNRWLLVVLFAVLWVSLILRERSYGFWAAGVTGMVALLHGFYGERGTSALDDRLLGVLVGCAIGLASAWFIAPVRTRDVLRRRIADCLAALTDDLGDHPDSGVPSRSPAALAQLDQLVPTLRAHRRWVRTRIDTHPLAAVGALHTLAELPTDDDERHRRRRACIRVRRAIVGRDDPDPADLPTELATVHAVLQGTARKI